MRWACHSTLLSSRAAFVPTFKYEALPCTPPLHRRSLGCRRLSVVKGCYDLCRVMDMCLDACCWCWYCTHKSQAIIRSRRARWHSPLRFLCLRQTHSAPHHDSDTRRTLYLPLSFTSHTEKPRPPIPPHATSPRLRLRCNSIDQGQKSSSQGHTPRALPPHPRCRRNHEQLL